MTASPDPLEAIVVKHIRSWQKVIMALGVMMLIIAAGVFITLGWFGKKPDLTVAAIGGLITSLIGIVPILLSLRNPRRYAAFRTIFETPQDVVWAYVSSVVTYGGAPTQSEIRLGLASGKLIGMNADLGEEQKLLAMLSRKFPWATLGYRPEIEQAFKKRPESLRRQPSVER